MKNWNVTVTIDNEDLGGSSIKKDPDSKIHGANMGPTWVLSAPDGPHIGPINLVIWGSCYTSLGIAIIKRWWSWDHLTFVLGIPMLGKRSYIKTSPWSAPLWRIYHATDMTQQRSEDHFSIKTLSYQHRDSYIFITYIIGIAILKK